jgi:hypothetical protein
MISLSLADAYQAQIDAANGITPPPFDAPPAPLTPDIKQMISTEVQRQLAIEMAEAPQATRDIDVDPASSGIVGMLGDNLPHVFVAGGDLDVIDARGQQCTLSPGDVVQLNPPNPPLPSNAIEATVVVLASKPQECVSGTSVLMQLADLQDMQNHMRETIDQGLGDLRTNSERGLLPAMPVAARVSPTTAGFAASAPPPDPAAGAEIAQQTREADQAEREVILPVQPPASPSSNVAQPVVTPGWTIDQVEARLGKPAHILQGNGTLIYTWKDSVKITFRDGKVVAIE